METTLCWYWLLAARRWKRADLYPLLRRPQFAGNPAHRVGFERIAGDRFGLEMTALAAFEGMQFETFRAGRDGNRYHTRVTLRTTRTMDRQHLWIGLSRRGHAGKIHRSKIGCLFGRRQNTK
jgi:hypothetical protein